MLSHSMSPRAVPRQETLVAWHPHEAEYELNVMITWCKSVALGRMSQGPLLAQAMMEGDEIVTHPAGQHLGPKELYNVWSEYRWGPTAKTALLWSISSWYN